MAGFSLPLSHSLASFFYLSFGLSSMVGPRSDSHGTSEQHKAILCPKVAWRSVVSLLSTGRYNRAVIAIKSRPAAVRRFGTRAHLAQINPEYFLPLPSLSPTRRRHGYYLLDDA